MKKTVWTFGLIAGAIMSLVMIATIPFLSSMGVHSYLVGYSTMVAAFLLVFFGVRSYRDNTLGGTIGFGRALAVGLLIVGVASLCYTATWEVMYYKFMPDFATKYAQTQVDHARADGKSEAEVAKIQSDMNKFAESYRNPVYNSAVTFMEPFPVGLFIALVSAGVLRRRRGETADAALAVA
jgi:hypothetical protein